MKLDTRESKVRVKIVDSESELPFYALYRPNKKKIFDLIKLSR